jgi:hypothetical protein
MRYEWSNKYAPNQPHCPRCAQMMQLARITSRFDVVMSADKQAVVKINDVGPLEPGRVIDLNERTMRYFDPALQHGLIPIRVTPLLGDDWLPGPIENS